jgi:hypothetical protein
VQHDGERWGMSRLDGVHGGLVAAGLEGAGSRLPDYQLTPSQWGAGGGSATHKEPTQAPSADSTQNLALNMAATSPPLSPSEKRGTLALDDCLHGSGSPITGMCHRVVCWYDFGYHLQGSCGQAPTILVLRTIHSVLAPMDTSQSPCISNHIGGFI